MMVATLVGSTLFAVPAAAAPDYVLDASGIQQTVLRAQMPSMLGAWRQNIYFADTNTAPYVYWSATGSPVRLPRPPTPAEWATRSTRTSPAV